MVQDLLQDTIQDLDHASSRGHAPPSTVQDLLQDDDMQALDHTSSRGHAPPSTVQDLLQADAEGCHDVKVGLVSSRGGVSASTVQHLLYDDECCGDELPSPPSAARMIPYQPPTSSYIQPYTIQDIGELMCGIYQLQ